MSAVTLAVNRTRSVDGYVYMKQKLTDSRICLLSFASFFKSGLGKNSWKTVGKLICHDDTMSFLNV